MTNTIPHMRAALAQAQAVALATEKVARTDHVNLLLHLAALKEEHPTDAALASTLVDCFDSAKAAHDWVSKARHSLCFMLDVLALQVAMEGTARAQRQAPAQTAGDSHGH